jgi:hypothetical protein
LELHEHFILGRPLALIRQNVATRRSGVIWSVSAKASIAYSPLIRKAFSRSKNCASACGATTTRTGQNAELQAIADLSVTRAAYLRLAETLNTFLTRLRSSAGALDVSERQRIMRLLVKEVLVTKSSSALHPIAQPIGRWAP